MAKVLDVIQRDNDVFIANRDVLFSEFFDKNGKGYGKYLAPNDVDADSGGYTVNGFNIYF